MQTLVLVLALAPRPATAQDAAPAPPASHARMVEVLGKVAEEARATNPFFGDAVLKEREQTLSAAKPDGPPKARWKLQRAIGFEELKLGRVEESVAAYERAREIQVEMGRKLQPQEVVDTWFDLGLASLRLGEVSNCVARHTSESCILPIRGSGVHVAQDGSRAAIQWFTEVLRYRPDHLPARWLLNLAYMTLGEYPDKVPAEYRVALSALDAGVEFPRFVDVAPELGVNSMTLAGGAVADDFDGDLVLDLVTTSWDSAGQMQYRKGLAGGTFEERTADAGLLGITGGLQLTHADYDNDGDLDLFVLRGAWMRQHGRWPNSLLRNDGALDGVPRFTDVTFDVGLAEPMFPTQAGAWGDFDNDGDLDLYVGNESSPEIAAPSQLFRNDGGKFVDVAGTAGVTNDRYAKGAAWGDVDGDRDLDLYVSNNGQANRLYRNKGDGTFEDVAEKLGVAGPIASFSTWFFDYDNDGALDLFVASYFPFVEPWVAWMAGIEGPFEPQALYRGDGKGRFVDVTRPLGLARPNCSMGSNFGDFDGDGFLDVYLGTGYPGYDGLMPNVALWNRGGGRFVDVTVPSGLGHLQKGHGVVFADFDGDGDQDLFEEMGGAFPGDTFGDALFRNPGFGSHRIEIQLTGVRTSRCAIGARIRCDVTEGDKKRSIYRWVSAGSSFGGNPLRQHIGIGKATKVDLLEIYWPTSDTTQRFADVPADRLVRITEGVSDYR